jgi:hypothetical protein
MSAGAANVVDPAPAPSQEEIELLVEHMRLGTSGQKLAVSSWHVRETQFEMTTGCSRLTSDLRLSVF